MIIGTDMYSAPALVSRIQSWVATGSASITVLSTRLHLDKSCNASLDTLNEPDCPAATKPTPTARVNTTAKPVVVSPSTSAVRSGEIGGFIIGAIIIAMLGVLIIVIVVVAMRKCKIRPSKR